MSAKKDMYLQVEKVIQKHSSSWTENTAFGSVYANFNEKLAGLQNLSDGQENSLIGVRALKDAKRDQTIGTAMEIVGALKALASVNSSPDLKAHVKIAESQLRFASKQDFLHLVNRILEKANEHSAELEVFGIDQAKIEALTALRDDVESAINMPRTAMIDRKTFTLKIIERFEELDEILKEQLDTLMLVLKKQHPDFYKDYKGARVVIEPKSKGSPDAKSTEDKKDNNSETNTETHD